MVRQICHSPSSTAASHSAHTRVVPLIYVCVYAFFFGGGAAVKRAAEGSEVAAWQCPWDIDYSLLLFSAVSQPSNSVMYRHRLMIYVTKKFRCDEWLIGVRQEGSTERTASYLMLAYSGNAHTTQTPS
jgi:hypothetical protein